MRYLARNGINDTYNWWDTKHGSIPVKWLSKSTHTLSRMYPTSIHYVTAWWPNDMGVLKVPRAPSLPFGYLFVPVLSDAYTYRLSPDPDAYAYLRFGLLYSVEWNVCLLKRAMLWGWRCLQDWPYLMFPLVSWPYVSRTQCLSPFGRRTWFCLGWESFSELQRTCFARCIGTIHRDLSTLIRRTA